MSKDERTSKDRPKMCPCPNSCKVIYNAMAFDDRIKDGDLDEGYSGDCIGKSEPTSYTVGGQVHENDMNQCVFTPLKGIIRFQICEGDVEGMLHMMKAVLHHLNPDRYCCKCRAAGVWVHWVIDKEGNRYCCSCYYKESKTQGQTEVTP